MLIALYVGALIVTALTRVSRRADRPQYPRLAQCGAVVLAANLGTAAMIFSFTPFVTQIGIQVLVPRGRAARRRAALRHRRRMSPWLLATGDFTPLGGMDRANHALASYLARHGRDGAPRGAPGRRDLAALPGVHVHLVPRPFGAHLLGAPLLARAAARQARALGGRGARRS